MIRRGRFGAVWGSHVGALLRWLGRKLWSLLTALLLVGAGVYLHFLWSGPELKPWHRVRLSDEFTAADYERGRVTTLDQYRARERLLLDQVRDEVGKSVPETDLLPFNRFNAGSRSDPEVWDVNWNRTFVFEPGGEPVGGVPPRPSSRPRALRHARVRECGSVAPASV